MKFLQKSHWWNVSRRLNLAFGWTGIHSLFVEQCALMFDADICSPVRNLWLVVNCASKKDNLWSHTFGMTSKLRFSEVLHHFVANVFISFVLVGIITSFEMYEIYSWSWKMLFIIISKILSIPKCLHIGGSPNMNVARVGTIVCPMPALWRNDWAQFNQRFCKYVHLLLGITTFFLKSRIYSEH